MIFNFRTAAIVFVSSAVCAHASSGDEKAAQVLMSLASAEWSQPATVSVSLQGPTRPSPLRAGFLPGLSTPLFGSSSGTSRLLFLSPLSPLRGALRLAVQDLAAQTLAVIDPPPSAAAEADAADAEASIDNDPETASRRREVLLRQRRKSVLNEREAGAEESRIAQSIGSDLDLEGLSGRVELMTLPSASAEGQTSDHTMPNGAGLVRVSGHLTQDLSFALTGLAAESAATTWRAGAEFELSAGERNRIEVGAVYGTRSNATNAPIGGEIDRRSVGAFRLVHALVLSDHITTRAGGRFVDAPFLRSSRSVDPEFSVLIEDPEEEGGQAFLRFALAGDTLFPGLEVATGGSDLSTLSEGLPVFAGSFEPQRTWTRGVAVGYHEGGSRVEARFEDQSVSNAMLVFPSSFAGAPFVENGLRNRMRMGSVQFEKTFAHGQAQTAVEYGYGHFALDAEDMERARGFHQITTRFDAYLRSSGTGIAIFHRFHEGAAVASRTGEGRGRMRAQRYLIELRQDVPFVPAMIGADMAVLVSVRNVYYDDIERRNIDEFAVASPPRRLSGGIRVKF